ncbi:unnamed protein product [Brassica napus]|uniref:adenylyl-sulfate kinase n=1 Tax=Brassica napus TaxID=3708 RepID=A0A816ICE9_BRANA|nr:unnamed protein product [Brassica napus]
MSKGPGLFSDIGKKAKDLLTRDYTSDHKFSISTYSASGVALTSTALKKGGVHAADVTTQYKYKNAVFDVKIHTDSTILTTVTFTEILPSTKAIVSFKVPDNSSGKLEVQYFHDHAAVTATAALKQNPLIDITATLGTPVISFGAEAGYDTSSKTFTKYNAGISVTKPDACASIILCYVSPAFGESRNLRPSLSDSRSLEPAGLKFRGKSQRRLSFFRRIMATDESISARRGETQQINGNVVWHACPITKSDRQELIKQKGCVIWITGLSGSGKSSLACALSRALYNRGKLSYILDGDNVRHGLNSDLSFKAEDRAENIRRVGEVARLFADAGIICIASLISPYRKERAACRALLPQGDFIEVFMDVPLHVCEARDPKGLYKRARAGEIKGFTGIDDPYEPPLDCEIVIQNNRDENSSSSLSEMAEIVVTYLDQNGYLKPS